MGWPSGFDHTAEHAAAHGDVHDAAGRAALVALLDGVDLTEQNRADLIAIEVLSQAVHRTARDGARELKELTRHRALETEDVGDAIAHLGYVGYFLGIDGSRQVEQTLYRTCSMFSAVIASDIGYTSEFLTD